MHTPFAQFNTQTVNVSLDSHLSPLQRKLQPRESQSVGSTAALKTGPCKLATGFITLTLHVELMTRKPGNTHTQFLSREIEKVPVSKPCA